MIRQYVIHPDALARLRMLFGRPNERVTAARSAPELSDGPSGDGDLKVDQPRAPEAK
jgi:hypothetical protein